MANADVVFRIDVQQGDTVGKLQEAEKAIEAVGKAGKEAAGGLKGTGTEAQTLTGGMSGLLAKVNPVGLALSAVQFTAAALGTAFVGLGAAMFAGVKASMEAEEQANRLRAALEGQGVGTDANARALQEYATALSLSTRYTDEAITAAMALGLRMGVNSDKIVDTTAVALDMATALGMSVDDAMTTLAKTLNGNSTALQKMGIDLGDMSKEAMKGGAAVKLLGERFEGAAEKDAKSLSGALDRVKIAMGEASEKFGDGITHSLNLGKGLNYVADVIIGALPYIEEFGRSIVAVLQFALKGLMHLFSQYQKMVGALAKIKGPIGEPFRALSEVLDAVEKAGHMAVESIDALAAAGARARAALAEPIIPTGKVVGGMLTMEEVHANILARMKARHLEMQGGIQDLPSGFTAMRERNLASVQPIAPDNAGVASAESAALAREEERAWNAEQTELRGAAIAQIMEYATANEEFNAGLERQRAAWASLSPQMQAYSVKQGEIAGKVRATKDIQNMFTGAIQQTVGALIQWAVTGEGSLRKILAATLTSLATESAGKAIFELAEAFAAAGRYDAPSAANHMAAAAMYGKIALVTGLGAIVAGRMGGDDEKEGGGGSGASDTGAGRDGRAAAENAQETVPTGPRIQLVVTGTIIGGTSPEDFARSVQPYLDEANAEAGGRSATGRG